MKKGSIYKWPLITGSLFFLLLLGFQVFVFFHPDYSVANPYGVLLANIGVFLVPFTISLTITLLFRFIKKKRE